MLSDSHHLARTGAAATTTRCNTRPGRRLTPTRVAAAVVAAVALLAAACSAEEPPAPPAAVETTTTTEAAPAETAAPAPTTPSPCTDPAAEDLGDGLVELDGVVYEVSADACVPRIEEPDADAQGQAQGQDDAQPAATPDPVTAAGSTTTSVVVDPVEEDAPAGATAETAPEPCRDGEHRHTPEGSCHTDMDVLTQPPYSCEDDWLDGTCTTSDGATYVEGDDGTWTHRDAETGADDAAEPSTTIAETATTACADMADMDDAWATSSPSDDRRFDLTQPGWYEWTLCVESADPNPDLVIIVQGLGGYAGADYSLSFPGMGSKCREGVEEVGPRRFRLRFPVSDAPYDASIEPEPCFAPVFNGFRGAWATEYAVRVPVGYRDGGFIVAPDVPYVAYFRLVRLGDAAGDED